ncbi:MAG: hypothetical protein ISR69_08190 [Gammaproteobacteria bacterium]|nr:hypothetical protein [Gammaproteobacteria bacterium]
MFYKSKRIVTLLSVVALSIVLTLKNDTQISAVSTESSSPIVHSEKLDNKQSLNLNTQLPFIQNQGQLASQVQFYAPTFAGSVYVTDQLEIVYALPNKQFDKSLILKESLVNPLPVNMTGKNPSKTKLSYFKGNDQKQWQSKVNVFDTVSVGEVYSGIELELKAYANNVEKLFHLKPKAKAEQIAIVLDGADSLSVNAKGELQAYSSLGTIQFSKPVAFQQVDNKKDYIEVAYAVTDNPQSLYRN